MRRSLYFYLTVFVVSQIAIVSAWGAKEDCGEYPNAPAKPAVEVREENSGVVNDYDEVIEEMTGNGVTYLSVINGDQPVPNACGLNPSNNSAEWTGWGGPLNADNMTIGEGAGTRNEIVIDGILFERGVGTHAAAFFIYPLTGGDYSKFECYVGMSDEKAHTDCTWGGSSEFIFSLDDEEVFSSGKLEGASEIMKVEFDIPAGASELSISVTDAGDGNSCDHSCLGDAKLLGAGLGGQAVEPNDKATTLWGKIKASY